MKKFSVLYLVSLYILLIMSFKFNLGEAFLKTIFGAGVFINVVLGVTGIIFEKLYGEDDNFFEEGLFIKLGTVPFFIYSFLLEVFGSFISLFIPSLDIVLPTDTRVGLVLVYSALVIPSCHSVISIYRLYREDIISRVQLIIYSILQCIFIIDVISYVILFFTKRNKL